MEMSQTNILEMLKRKGTGNSTLKGNLIKIIIDIINQNQDAPNRHLQILL